MREKNQNTKLVHSWTSRYRGVFLGRILYLGIFFSLSGCTLGSFFGGGKDNNVLNVTAYRKVNQNCSFKADKLDEDTLISLMKCLNANGALPKTVKLLETAGKENLTPLVKTINEHLISNKERIYELEVSHQTLVDRKISKEVLKQIGIILQNGEFISNLISSLKDGFTIDARELSAKAKAGDRVPDPDLLKAISLLADGLSEDIVDRAMRLGLNISGADSFKFLNGEFQKGLASLKSSPRRTLSLLTDGLYYFNRDKHTYYCDKDHPEEEIRAELFQAVRNNDLFNFLDALFEVSKSSHLHGGPADPLRDKISTYSIIMKTLTHDPGNNQDELIKKLGVAFRELIPQTISCINDGAQISNPALLIVKELAEKKRSNPGSPDLLANEILQSYPLQFMALRPFCELPKNLDAHYSTLREVARIGYKEDSLFGTGKSASPLIDPLTGILSTAYFSSVREWKGCDGKSSPSNPEEYHLIANLFLHALADIDPHLNMRGSSGAKRGLDYLLPIFREFSQRDAWVDLLLVATLPGTKDREDLKALTLYVVEPRAELNGKSIGDVFADTLARQKSPRKLYKLVSSLGNYSKLENDFLEQFLLMARQAFYSNNVHPLFQLTKDLLKDAPKNPDFLKAFLNISELDEFSEALAEISEMSKDDRLEAVISGMLKVFHRFAEQGKNPKIQELKVPAFVASRRHNFTRSQIVTYSAEFNPDLKQVQVNRACDQLSFDVSIFKGSDSRSSEQLDLFLKCMNGKGEYDDLVNAVTTLRGVKTSSNASLFDVQVGLIKRLEDHLSSDQSSVLINHWRSYFNLKTAQGVLYMNNLLDFFPLLVRGRPVVSGDRTTGPILGPALKVIGALAQSAKDDLVPLKEFFAKLLEGDDFPLLLGDIRSLLFKEVPESKADLPSDPIPASKKGLNPEEEKFVRDVWSLAWHGPVGKRFTPEFILRIREWVKNKECVGLDSDVEILNRVVRVLNEPRDNVNNWELVSDGKGGRETRKRWKFEEFKFWLEKVVVKLSRPAHIDRYESLPVPTPFLKYLTSDHPRKELLDAQLDFLRYFSRPEIQDPAIQTSLERLPQVRSNRNNDDNRVSTQFSPGWLKNWFYDRAIDYHPITYFYPGETTPRVRIVNTLDKFELVTYNGDFLAPYLKKNLGLKNLARLGDAWGDLTESEWPAAIRGAYKKKGHKPQTILEAVKEITNPPAKLFDPSSWLGTEDMHTLGFYVMGLPKLPDCHKDIEGVTDLDSKQMRWTARRFQGLFDDSYRYRLYNIMQVISVMEENAPGGPTGPKDNFPDERKGYGYGLEFFRNLFFELNYSSPLYADATNDDIEQGKDRNNLTIVSYSNKMGLLRLVGSLLHNVREDDPLLNDLFYVIVHAAKIPEVKKLLVVTYEKPEGLDVFWNLIQEFFSVIQDGDEKQLRQLRETLYYCAALLQKLEPWKPSVEPSVSDGGQEILALGAQRATEILLNPALSKALAKDHHGVIQGLLTSDLSSLFLKKIYHTISDPKADPNVQDRLKNLILTFLKATQDQTPLTQNGLKALMALYADPADVQTGSDVVAKIRALYGSDEWNNLEIEKSALPLVYFFQHKSMDGQREASQEEQSASDRLRKNMSSILRSTDLDELAIYAKSNPEEFDRILTTLSHYMGQKNEGEFKDFLKLLHQRLSAPRH